MHRFFVSPHSISGTQVSLDGPAARQIRDVLRLRPGDRILVLDNSGWAWQVELRQVGATGVMGQVAHRALAQGEPRTKITLYQAVLKGRRFEFTLQKGTELGIVEFVPLISDRTIMADLGAVGKKHGRWTRIVQEAAEQCRRGRQPTLEPAMLFPSACERAQQQGRLALMAWEGDEGEGPGSAKPLLSLKKALRGQRRRPFTVSLLIGPEGGFSLNEAMLAQQYGIPTVTLGPRILRAETAGLVAATAILYELGDLE